MAARSPPSSERVIAIIGYPDTRYWHAGGVAFLAQVEGGRILAVALAQSEVTFTAAAAESVLQFTSLSVAPTSRGLKSSTLVVGWNDSTRPVFYLGIQGQATEGAAGAAVARRTPAVLALSGPAAGACGGRPGRGKQACGSLQRGS